jgi:hypothetical protein
MGTNGSSGQPSTWFSAVKDKSPFFYKILSLRQIIFLKRKLNCALLTIIKKIYTKRILLLSALSFIVAVLFAQGGGVAPLAKGEKQINFGTGFSSHGLPIYGSLDIALHKDITLTPEVHVRLPFFNEDDFSGGVMVKADYHWNYLIGIPSNWDFYAGARAGINFGGDIYPDLGIQVGGRWYFNPNWALNLEFGGGTGFDTTFGLSYKL